MMVTNFLAPAHAAEMDDWSRHARKEAGKHIIPRSLPAVAPNWGIGRTTKWRWRPMMEGPQRHHDFRGSHNLPMGAHEELEKKMSAEEEDSSLDYMWNAESVNLFPL